MARRTMYDFTRLNLTATAAEVRAELGDIVARYKRGVAAAAEGTGFAGTFERLAAADGEAAFRSIVCVLPSLTSGCADSRAASAEAKRALGAMWADAYSSTELYTALRRERAASANAEQRRLVDVTLERFEMNGAHLAEPQRTAFSNASKAAAAMASRFEENINEDTTTVAFAADELEGLPEGFLAALPTDPATGKLVANIKAPVRVPILQQARRAATREAMWMASSAAVAEKNGPLLNELRKARHDAATAAGFATHADFVMQPKTARTAATAQAFCEDMLARLLPKYRAEMEELMAAAGAAGPLAPWDVAYYVERLRKEKGIDTEQLKHHFPLQESLDRVLGIYADLLGLEITLDAELPRWHPDVLAYRVCDRDAAGTPLKGYIYLDLFPREGKFGHQMILPLAPCFAHTDADGGAAVASVPACCYMGNVSKGEGGRPPLLRISEVQTLFHEMGHAMHCVCTATSYSILSWAWPMVPWPGGVEQDFLEVPSTMFESWMTAPEVVDRVSSEVAGKKIDPAVVAKLKDTRHHLAVVERYAKYYAMALADLEMHGSRIDEDADALYKETLRKALGQDLPAATHPAASWYHVAIGYDAGYYGYGWADVHAKDLFVRFQEDGLFDAQTGRRLRELILAPCAGVPATEMLEGFLGRAPSHAAYLAELGIGDTAAEKAGAA
eukprot:TRINITY_DN4620_c0_g1_i1.p1 TRINITY_DN4620_c0_g1~~TRINITY_DN4620_c0_g1_i1.p1  ORF type:complete len:675 (+),score=267.63 TRINITY_DN4620_c0_g1_i1:64-2088(+)